VLRMSFLQSFQQWSRIWGSIAWNEDG
jgi:hypothetical protein